MVDTKNKARENGVKAGELAYRTRSQHSLLGVHHLQRRSESIQDGIERMLTPRPNRFGADGTVDFFYSCPATASRILFNSMKNK